MTAPWQPLRGIRVLELALFVPGPYAGREPARLGANVIKLEPPGGDPARRLSADMFRVNNCGKRSICVDLKRAAASLLVDALAQWADVVIEGFRPGVAERLGVGYARLAEVNPALVYCALSGYGQQHPKRRHPGHDLTYLAAAGALHTPGHWHGPPRRGAVPVADLGGALYGVSAILAALLERVSTGHGRYIDVSLTAAATALAGARGTTESTPPRGHLHPSNDLFTCADGELIAAGLIEDHFWAGFVQRLETEHPALAAPELATLEQRQASGDALHALLERVFSTRPRGAWLEFAAESGLPLEAVRTPWEAARDLTHAGDCYPAINTPEVLPAPASPGEHSAEILRELGFRDTDRQRFATQGVLA